MIVNQNPLNFGDDTSCLRRHQIPQRIRCIIAAEFILVGIYLEHVFGSIRIRNRRAPRSRERERMADWPRRSFAKAGGQVRDVRQDRIPIALYVRNDNRKPRLIKLIATCGALDMDDPQPAITVMMPDED